MTTPPTRQQDDLTELCRQRRFAELEEAATRVLRASPHDGFAWSALGVACAALSKPQQALEAKVRAVELMPRDAPAHNNLANALRQAGRDPEAEARYRQALALDERLVPAWQGLAGLLASRGRHDDAADCMRRLVSVLPGSAKHHNDWGNALRNGGRMHDARKAYEQALALKPDFGEALCNLGNTLADLGHPIEAERRYREALEFLPRQAEIHSNLGNLLKEQGRLPEASACYRSAIELAPAFAGGHSNLLLALNHDAAIEPVQARAEAERFGARAAAAATMQLALPGPRRSTGPLKVGLVSADLRNHPVGYFIEGLVHHLDPNQVRLHAYTTLPLEDALTARIKPRFAQWRQISGLSDEAAARAIHADGIELLLDLSGHTAHNRLGLFAWRPASVQASWLGYFATTGLAAMDWVIADRTSVPPEAQSHFTERVAYLPVTRLCFEPPADAPDVAPLPALQRGHVTFGSFQNLGKVNDEVLALWGRVLAAVPGSVLRMQNPQVGDPAMRDEVLRRAERAGIARERIAFHGRSARLAYLRAHAEVDLLLDTFPYPGGTTTCEALWMGVPTLTLAGHRMLSRQGASLLKAAQLPEWVASDEQDYVRRAAAFASGLPALAALRARLREHVSGTALFDAPRFARDFTALLYELADSPTGVALAKPS